MEDLLGDFSFN